MKKAGLLGAKPQGAFYLFPGFSPMSAALAARGVSTSQELCDRLLEETGVAILPGSAFGRPPTELTCRIAYVDFDGARALAATEALPPHAPLNGPFLRTHCKKVLIAVERICAWVDESEQAAPPP